MNAEKAITTRRPAIDLQPRRYGTVTKVGLICITNLSTSGLTSLAPFSSQSFLSGSSLLKYPHDTELRQPEMSSYVLSTSLV